MTPQLFLRFSNIAYARAGIRLREGKESLVAARIAKRIRELGMSGGREYLEYLERDEGDELVRFLDAISTNFTSFFRENDHFDQLEAMVRERVLSGRNRLRIWSAACSTGEEPYSVAMTVSEAVGHELSDWRVLATDISTRVLHLARAGVYDDTVIKPLTKAQRLRHMERAEGHGARGALWRIRQDLREHVVFRRLNLSSPPFPMKGPLDAVFCRNVMIYFDQPVRQRLISAIESVLAVDGILFIGHSETLSGLETRLRPVKPSVYVRSERLDEKRRQAAHHNMASLPSRT